MAQKKKKKLTPAQKGVATRKANARRAKALEKKRAAAAQRGWETRRKNAKHRAKQAREKAQRRRQRNETAAAGGSVPESPSKKEITSAVEFDKYVDDWEMYGGEFEDQGEVDAGVDY